MVVGDINEIKRSTDNNLFELGNEKFKISLNYGYKARGRL